MDEINIDQKNSHKKLFLSQDMPEPDKLFRLTADGNPRDLTFHHRIKIG